MNTLDSVSLGWADGQGRGSAEQQPPARSPIDRDELWRGAWGGDAAQHAYEMEKMAEQLRKHRRVDSQAALRQGLQEHDAYCAERDLGEDADLGGEQHARRLAAKALRSVRMATNDRRRHADRLRKPVHKLDIYAAYHNWVDRAAVTYVRGGTRKAVSAYLARGNFTGDEYDHARIMQTEKPCATRGNRDWHLRLAFGIPPRFTERQQRDMALRPTNKYLLRYVRGGSAGLPVGTTRRGGDALAGLPRGHVNGAQPPGEDECRTVRTAQAPRTRDRRPACAGRHGSAANGQRPFSVPSSDPGRGDPGQKPLKRDPMFGDALRVERWSYPTDISRGITNVVAAAVGRILG